MPESYKFSNSIVYFCEVDIQREDIPTSMAESDSSSNSLTALGDNLVFEFETDSDQPRSGTPVPSDYIPTSPETSPEIVTSDETYTPSTGNETSDSSQSSLDQEEFTSIE